MALVKTPRRLFDASVLAHRADAALDGKGRIRRDHLRRALSIIAAADHAVTRASIARRTGLTTATTSSLVNELISLGLAVEAEAIESTGGKPGIRIELDRSFYLVGVVLVRAFSVEATALDLAGVRVSTEVTRFPDGVGPADAVAAAGRLAAEYGDRLLGLCLQSPGVTDGAVVEESVLLGWSDVPLAALVSEVAGAPVLVLNDADGEALTEAAFDERPEAQRLVLRLGEGIGVATTDGGAVLTGATHRAGEIGHVSFGPRGAGVLCRCGSRGCLEATASLAAVLGDRFHDELGEEESRALMQTDGYRDRLRTAADDLGGALRVLSALIDPHEIVIAGRGPLLGDEFLALVREAFDGRRAKGTATPGIRFAHAADAALGPARHLLTAVLGVALMRPGGARDDAST
ncbi:ROK family protein [Streptomyces sp. AC495_CC817]|uniref:ROK family protein n=1 Tax=Streptomyces sp. AC495_CC817 TaxID=2823900 RepID=UPI0020B80882|nr:ROK family protein [Streptomyces sp. AC495_CC817]